MTYPVIVLIMSLVAVIGMLIFIVPIFEKMFEGLGGDLPLPTQILVVLSQVDGLGRADRSSSAASASRSGGAGNKNTERVRKFVDPLKLKLPVFGTLLKKIAIARFTRNFSDMIGAGVPILQALSDRRRDLGQLGDRAGAREGRGLGAAGQVDLRAALRGAGLPGDGRADDRRR